MSSPAGVGHAVVTGAGSGIGRAIALAAASAGYRVGVLDRDPAAAVAVASAINGRGNGHADGNGATGNGVAGPRRDAVPLVADVADEAAVEIALDAFGAVPDLWVNNAGIVRFAPLLDQSLTDWRSVVDVNLTGTFVGARAAARRMLAAGVAGTIVNITSMNGVAPGPNAGAYGATKAAVALLTQQMALEWGPKGVRVNAVAPGLIDAGMSEPIYADPEFRERRGSKVPLGRLGRAEDVAAVVLFLASPAAAYVTGQNVLVDGGVTSNIIGQLPRPEAVDRVGAPE
jgi:NAD(P)-dependent dehydrogenase (short-subunit alcohol dehydrogenase family)